MTDPELLARVRAVVGGARTAIEAHRSRIDDLNVYPVPDGDTGTNLAHSLAAVDERLAREEGGPPAALAFAARDAALKGGRGNSGVILSQILRGLCAVLGEATRLDAPALAAALRAASDAAYRGVGTPVEGTMLTVVREMAEEAEGAAEEGATADELLDRVLARGADAVRRTPDLLARLKEAGVVDAGGAGLVEIARGAVGGLRGESPVQAVAGGDDVRVPASISAYAAEAHGEESRFRYCTNFVVTGGDVDPAALEGALAGLGDSLLVVGDPEAVRVHVHTDDPGRALSAAVVMGGLEAVEIADMHAQIEDRNRRLDAAASAGAPSERPALRLVADEHRPCDVVCVVAGDGNAALAAREGARGVVRGGPTMNPSTQELLEAIESCDADGVVVLPNDGNVILAARAAAAAASRPARVVETRSIPEGLAALIGYDRDADLERNAAAMARAAADVVSGEVTRAVRDATIDGHDVRAGAFLGLVAGRVVVADASPHRVVAEVAARLLDDDRESLTVLRGADVDADLDAIVAALAGAHPDVEVEILDGGQPHYPLLLGAE